ncbi:MAG: hypothetical protein LBJ94_03690 [Puniceicoccales bacterium]|jgi:hypothetical protein|nr:hypothetical protein [Puniceicoccales bacterium]
MALALPHSDFYPIIKERKCVALSTQLSPERGLACDSCISVYHQDETGGWAVGSSPDAPEEWSLAQDINKRGALVFAEMQQKKNKVPRRGTQVDDIQERMMTYASGLRVRDHGDLDTRNRGEREGKRGKDIQSRPIIGVSYKGYKDCCEDESVGSICHKCTMGGAFACVNIGSPKFFDGERLIKDAKEAIGIKGPDRPLSDVEKRRLLEEYNKEVREKIERFMGIVNRHLQALSEETKKLVGEILVVFSMSHLFTQEIVKAFHPVVQLICEILEVNMDNINKASERLSDEEVMALIGNFDNVKKAEDKLREAKLQKCSESTKIIVQLTGSATFKIRDYSEFSYWVMDPAVHPMVIRQLEARKAKVGDLDLESIKNEIVAKYSNSIRDLREMTIDEFCEIVPETWLREAVIGNLIGTEPENVDKLQKVLEVSRYADEVIEEQAKGEIKFCDFYRLIPDLGLYDLVYSELQRRCDTKPEVLMQMGLAIPVSKHVNSILEVASEDGREILLENIFPSDLRQLVKSVIDEVAQWVTKIKKKQQTRTPISPLDLYGSPLCFVCSELRSYPEIVAQLQSTVKILKHANFILRAKPEERAELIGERVPTDLEEFVIQVVEASQCADRLIERMQTNGQIIFQDFYELIPNFQLGGLVCQELQKRSANPIILNGLRMVIEAPQCADRLIERMQTNGQIIFQDFYELIPNFQLGELVRQELQKRSANPMILNSLRMVIEAAQCADRLIERMQTNEQIIFQDFDELIPKFQLYGLVYQALQKRSANHAILESAGKVIDSVNSILRMQPKDRRMSLSNVPQEQGLRALVAKLVAKLG